MFVRITLFIHIYEVRMKTATIVVIIMMMIPKGTGKGDSESSKTLFCMQLIRPENKRHLVRVLESIRCFLFPLKLNLYVHLGDRHRQ